LNRPASIVRVAHHAVLEGTPHEVFAVSTWTPTFDS
jgi:hypothetical protein